MRFKDLRDFLDYLEKHQALKRISLPVDPRYEMTEISDRTLRAGGPALLFENPIGFDFPVLTNLFGTPERVAMGMGREQVQELREVGKLLAYLKEPEPPRGFKEAWHSLPLFKQVLNMPAKRVKKAACQEIVWQGDEVDLDKLPVMSCWAEDVAPLLTWGLTITQGPYKNRQNLGIYRQQKLAKNKIIMRWLAHRGGALDFQDWQQAHPNQPFPVSIAFGADPATILGAVTPVPDTLSEYAFAGLLRGSRTEVVKSLSNELDVPASAEIVLEGYIDPNEYADEGPYGDHTGYYNEVERHHVMTITHISMRKDAIYHSTYTGRPPDEPAILGVALNEVFVPILQKQFPEIVDFYLPPEGCSYRLAIVTIKKQYPGHAKRIMMGVWSFLRQFMYTKYVIICDESVNARDWQAVSQAMVEHMDPVKDSLFIEHTPIDSLDFASPVVGLGSKLGMDATIKWAVEQPLTQEVKGKSIAPTEQEWQAFLQQHPTLISYHYLVEHNADFVALCMDKKQTGQSKVLLNAVMSFLAAYHSGRFVVLCDPDIALDNWQDIIWAITTRMDPARDTLSKIQEVSGLTQLGFDATNKREGEVQREWGRPIKKDPQLMARIDAMWDELSIL